MNINCTHLSEKPKNYKERGNASLSDNLKYINDSVSHVEINRYQGAGPIKYCVTAKALTINVISGKKAFIVWASQEHEDFETAVQKAKDELKNRIVLGFPILQHASPNDDVKNLVEYK